MGEHEEDGGRYCVHCGTSFDAHDHDSIAPQWCPNRRQPGDFEAVGEFHHRFGLPNVEDDGFAPRLLPRELTIFRLKFLMEELAEIEEAFERHDLPGVADGLVDLVYVALGTAQLMGLPWNELFSEVQRANMMKERAAQDGSNSKRGSSFDVVKPPGWRPPGIIGVLERHGWGRQR